MRQFCGSSPLYVSRTGVWYAKHVGRSRGPFGVTSDLLAEPQAEACAGSHGVHDRLETSDVGATIDVSGAVIAR